MVLPSGRATVGGPGLFQPFEGFLDIAFSDSDASAYVLGCSGAVFAEPVEDAVFQAWEPSSLDEVKPHRPVLGVPLDPVLEVRPGFGFTVFALEGDERRLAVAFPAEACLPGRLEVA